MGRPAAALALIAPAAFALAMAFAPPFARAEASKLVIAENVSAAKPQDSFASKAEAEAYLAHALLAATAANASYKAANSDIATRWLTKAIMFRAADGGIVVSMNEEVLDYRGDALVREGTHDTEFAIDATDVALIDESGAIVGNLVAAEGVLFKCRGAPCIQTARDGQKSVEAATDISIDDLGERGRIYSAFRALLNDSGVP
jgi:hypothetical protein